MKQQFQSSRDMHGGPGGGGARERRRNSSMRSDEEEIERQKAMLLRKIARFQKAKNHL